MSKPQPEHRMGTMIKLEPGYAVPEWNTTAMAHCLQQRLYQREDSNTYEQEPTEQNLRNNSPCAKCGGLCCKRMGCHYSPEDFAKITFDSLRELLDQGKISIDWCYSEGQSDRMYYLRTRHKGAPIVDPAFDGVCVNLTNTGCSFDWEHRPKGGRFLQADPRFVHCKNHYSNLQCAQDWDKYSDILCNLVEYYGGAEDPDWLDYINSDFFRSAIF